MKTILIILSVLIMTTTAKNINSKVIRAHDGYRSSGHTTHRGGGRHQDDILLSTIDATSQISVQVTSVLSLEASTQATSQEPQNRRRHRNYSQIKFLKNNRVQITQDISKGNGEYLITLLNMMNIKQDTHTLSKIQSNFETLFALEDEKFLSKLTEISNS
ncbi:MAG TPA: DUF3015 domain-containing protein [Campylobacterales bacterium]|nr:DUF3015 domain-containing protein [Campylobacterales bacterium]